MADRHEKTFILLKPDAVQRGVVGEIITRFERKGFKLVALKFLNASPDQLKQHYGDLSTKPFFAGLISFASSGPVVAMVWEGLGVVKSVRTLLGQTDPAASAPGTIRGDLCILISRNLIHGSDSIENANKEIKLWFADNELVCWKPTNENWLYEN